MQIGVFSCGARFALALARALLKGSSSSGDGDGAGRHDEGKKGFAMKKTMLSVVALALVSALAVGCAVDADSEGGAELQAAFEQASQDESFRVTVDMLAAKGVELDRSAARLEDGEGDIAMRLRIPLVGEGYEALMYEVGTDALGKVLVEETALLEPLAQAPGSAAGGCGTYLYANNCKYGPWVSGSGCDNGPLYKYDSYTRQIYTNGRKLSYQYSLYSCNWMAQDSSCTATCN